MQGLTRADIARKRAHSHANIASLLAPTSVGSGVFGAISILSACAILLVSGCSSAATPTPAAPPGTTQASQALTTPKAPTSAIDPCRPTLPGEPGEPIWKDWGEGWKPDAFDIANARMITRDTIAEFGFTPRCFSEFHDGGSVANGKAYRKYSYPSPSYERFPGMCTVQVWITENGRYLAGAFGPDDETSVPTDSIRVAIGLNVPEVADLMRECWP